MAHLVDALARGGDLALSHDRDQVRVLECEYNDAFVFGVGTLVEERLWQPSELGLR